MTISVLLDPAQMPDQSQDQLDFDNKMSGLMRDLPILGAQINATEASMSTFAAGGAYAFPYVFDNATADADPGPGKLRLSSATQNAATVLRADALALGGANMVGIFDALSLVSSAIKGGIRIVKAGDASKWLLFDVLGVASGSGYRNMTVAHRAGSSSSPFAKDDALVIYIDRNGDAGTQLGNIQLLATQVVPSGTPVAAIAFPDVFSDLYDSYIIEMPSIISNTDSSLPQFQFYINQIPADVNTVYAVGNAGGALTNANATVSLSGASGGVIRGVLTIRGARSTNDATSFNFDGVSTTTASGNMTGVARRGFVFGGAIKSGFAIRATSSYTIYGTVRVYGIGK